MQMVQLNERMDLLVIPTRAKFPEVAHGENVNRQTSCMHFKIRKGAERDVAIYRPSYYKYEQVVCIILRNY